MKLVWEPKVYLIGQQTVLDEAVFEFLANESAAPNWATDSEVSGEELIEIAGRTCYMSFPKPRPGGNKAYMNHILESGHGSVLEHQVFSFILTGVSRSFSHELVRHRVGWGYSQLSQRYVDEGDVSVVVPPALKGEVEAYLAWLDDGSSEPPKGPALHGQDWVREMENDLAAYRRLSDYLFGKYADIADKTARRKAAREAARSVLPNATETKIVCTANSRALRHFVEMRASAMADAEIARVAIALLDQLKLASPNVFGDYATTKAPDGRRVAVTPYRKV